MDAPGPTKTTHQADTLRLELAQVQAETDRLKHAALDLRKLDDARRRPSHAWTEMAERALADWERATEATEKRATLGFLTVSCVAATIRQAEAMLDLAETTGALKGLPGTSSKDLLVLRLVGDPEDGSLEPATRRAFFGQADTFELHATIRGAKSRQPGLRVERVCALRSKGLLVVRKSVQAYAPGEAAPPVDPTEQQLEDGATVFLTGRIGRGHLGRRLTALRRLREHWQASHLPLLQLFNPESRGWGEAQMVNHADLDADWHLLKGAGPAIGAARSFVRKAIGTTDFTLLEATPGPARRTAVLELILQAVARGQRLLLVAAEAAELDEVLAGGATLPGWGEQVAAVRLTDPCEPTAPAAQAFDLDRQVARLVDAVSPLSRGRRPREVAASLLLETCNLVGAPLAALGAHPSFRPAALARDPADFDQLIVLGAERLGFADFLVPAVHARRWILVADPRVRAGDTDLDELAEQVVTEASRARLLDELQAELAFKACVGKDGSAEDEDADIPDAHGRRKVLLVLDAPTDEARSLATAQAYLRQRQLQTATIPTAEVAAFDPAALSPDLNVLICARAALTGTELALRLPPEFRLIVGHLEPELLEPLARRVKLPKARGKSAGPSRAKPRPLIFLDWQRRCAANLQGLYDFRRPGQEEERSRHIRALLLDLKSLHPFEKPLWEPQALLRLKEQELCSIFEVLQNGAREPNAPDRSESVHHAGLPRPFGLASRLERLPEA